LALDLFDIIELAWHDCYEEVTDWRDLAASAEARRNPI
jgi:hypothetical protein